MPYIVKQNRKIFDGQMKALLRTVKSVSSGELNYIITRIVLARLANTLIPSYEDYNSVIGALECAKLELYRRRLSLLEDRKAIENGDVY